MLHVLGNQVHVVVALHFAAVVLRQKRLKKQALSLFENRQLRLLATPVGFGFRLNFWVGFFPLRASAVLQRAPESDAHRHVIGLPVQVEPLFDNLEVIAGYF